MDRGQAPAVIRAAGAIAVGLLAFALYYTTLLPGLDLGDTPSFQVVAGRPVISARDGYPLYFALGRLFVPVAGNHDTPTASNDNAATNTTVNRAYALNLASAVEAALACLIFVLVAAELSGSVAAAVAAGFLFAGSYTFWSQAVIAEVYALHVLLIGLTLLLLLRWDRAPSLGRLALFFATYALAFGNHLTMILLAPAYALFLLARREWRSVLTTRAIGLAMALAFVGSLQYLWNFRSLWLSPVPPASLAEGLQSFWFDVTKADWRESMLLKVPAGLAPERFRMYVFDLHQQFGWPPVALAAAGLMNLLFRAPKRGALLLLGYLATMAFALSYNVGDTHVFLLPSHFFVALLVAPGIVGIARIIPRNPVVAPVVMAVLTTALASYRIYRDFPALDRSDDHRAARWLGTLTAGVDDRDAILITDLNWQLDNGLNYFVKEMRKEVAYARLPDVVDHLPRLVRDNLAIGRAVVLSERAADAVAGNYGSMFRIERDLSATTPAIDRVVERLPDGTPYVLCILRPTRDVASNPERTRHVLQRLTGNNQTIEPKSDYFALAGHVGSEPTLVRESTTPFAARVELNGQSVAIRMESWLAFDTIRRMGFGHVIAGRRHALIVERGVSFVAFGQDGRPLDTAYADGLYAPQVRSRVRDQESPGPVDGAPR